MKKEFHTPSGKITRELTKEEINIFAESGDIEAKKEIVKEDFKQLLTNQEKIDKIAAYLGLI